ncbi:MAG: hypothetical protein ACR2OZ_08895 [Verrucomicrobiales bacterium]
MIRLLVLLFAVAASSEPALGQQTAKKAISSLARERGWGVAHQVVLVAGERGQDQPVEWRIVARDPESRGRFLEFAVRNGHVIEEHLLTPDEVAKISRAPLAQKRVRIDSRQLFALADKAAKKAHIGFDNLDYELRNREFSQEPIWSVRLNDSGGEMVGELAVAADSGAILRRMWSQNGRGDATPLLASHGRVRHQGTAAGPSPRPVRGETVSSPESGGLREQANLVWERTRDGIQHGHDLLRSNVKRASDGLRGLFGRSSSAHTATWENRVDDDWE